ncbi:MAG: hypothetical protein J07HX64_01275 [halophilic archaeon J07HX64]|nr:MAG: hypothetical protein J07HX64_01275 [halophilic archaeon J07HX64]
MLLAVDVCSVDERLVPGRDSDSLGLVDPVREGNRDTEETFVISPSNRVNNLVASHPIAVCLVQVSVRANSPWPE